MQFESTRVEALLSKALGARVEVARSVRLSPWFVVRCHLASGSAAVPASAIVKTLRDNPSAAPDRADPIRVRTEQVGLELVAELISGLAPRLIASDLEVGILILEDLAPRTPLAEILGGDDASLSAEGLLAFSRALGTLHAVSTGHEDLYDTKCRVVGAVAPNAERRLLSRDRWSEVRGYMDSLGAPPSSDAEADLSDAVAALTEPGAFLALTNGDAAVNNYMVNRGDGRIIDFEAARYRHALLDPVCLYVPGPLWITVDDPIANGIEAEYRAALSVSVPEAEDDVRFGFGLAAACLVTAIGTRLHRFPTLDRRREGDQSRVQMVATLEAAANSAESHHSLPHLGGWAREIAAKLRRIWPDADVDLGGYGTYVPRMRAST